MKIYLKISSFIVLLLLFISCTEEQISSSIPRSTPEAEGISSEAILNFVKAADESETTEFHSFMILRHGKVIAEGWWNPFGPDLKHTLYSASKSFTSTAVGLAIQEGKLSLDDQLISIFPESLPDSISPNLEKLKIRHMLSMATGQRREPPITTQDWIKSYLETPVEFEPGTRYRYSSVASFMLSATVQKVTGEKVIDYLTPRLFEPLGIEGADWETNPQGINTGGWGLRLKTEDLAKFGLLYLQKGKWNGKQILNEEWVDEATSLKIQQRPNMTQEERDSSDDSVQGYCYQFWRAKNNSYQVNGYAGQFVLIVPEKDMVVVFTAESRDMWGELGMVWEYIYPELHDEALPENEEAVAALKDKIASLNIPAPEKNVNEEMSSKISGKTIYLEENQMGFQSVSLQFTNDICQMNLKTENDSYDLSFGAGEWKFGETALHGPTIFPQAVNALNGLPPFKIACAYAWTEDNSLELTLRYRSMHIKKYILNFKENDEVDLEYAESISWRPTNIEGKIQ